MSKQRCGNCRYFTSARSCYDEPTWGHCTWPAQDQEDAGPDGRFNWADDTCEHHTARRKATARS